MQRLGVRTRLEVISLEGVHDHGVNCAVDR